MHSRTFVFSRLIILNASSFLRQDCSWDTCHLGLTRYTRWQCPWLRMAGSGCEQVPGAWEQTGLMYRWLGWGASWWVCISSAHLVVTEGKKWQKSLFMPCRQEDLFCWRGDVSQDSTRFRPKVVWEWLGASNPRLFVFYKDGIDGCCFLGRRKESSNKIQSKTKNRIP